METLETNQDVEELATEIVGHLGGPTEENMESKDDYYKDNRCASFSTLKVFSKCETLYRDLFVTKTYEEPDHDYFTYGKLVDAVISEPDGFVEENFVRVDRKIQPEKALKIENDIKELEKEIEEKTALITEKIEKKKEPIIRKLQLGKTALTKDPKNEKTLKMVDKLEGDLEKVEPDKVLTKGINTRGEKILELQGQLDTIKELANKIQVTNAIWCDAEETADAIKAHPSFSTIEFNQVTSQQIFRTEKNGVKRKGKLDHLKLSPALTKLYAIYAAEQMTLDELRARIPKEVHPQDLWAIITDIKTCFSVEKLEPFNTHYRGQLGWYQDLVSETLLIPVNQVRCRILVGDKKSNTFKTCELFEYSQDALDELKPDVEAWAQLWQARQVSNQYISAKEKYGMNQKCFTCTECRNSPFSTKPGEPVLITGPRFPQK